jgi:glycosyltransferase involved in cell wall biosynthesis
MGTPRVSVIIPCYNAEAFVGQAIESVLAQTYPEIEIIAVDDGSSDGTRRVLEAFGNRVRLEEQPHKGAPVARNRGLALSTGDRIQFLDADDVLLPEKIERQMAAMEATGADLVFCDGEAVDFETGAPVKRYYPRHADTFRLCCFDSVQTVAPLHRKAHVVEVGGFRETLPCAQEKDLHLRLACRGVVFHHLPDVLFRERKRRESLSSDFVRVLDQYEDIFGSARQQLQSAGLLSDERARVLAEVMVQAGRYYISRDQITKGRHYIACAKAWHASAGLGIYPPASRLLYHLVGPVATQRLVDAKRRMGLRRSGKEER